MGLGWLFGKKKVLPPAPLPGARPFNENTFNFSKKFGGETLIEPEQIQEAAGFNTSFNFPDLDAGKQKVSPFATTPPAKTAPIFTGLPPTKPHLAPPAMVKAEPLFVKVDVYQKILEEMDQIRGVINKMQTAGRILESSEYNEENHFDRLKKSMKSAHDKMLQIDKVLFNAKGE